MKKDDLPILDLDNPIFVFYINGDNLSNQHLNQLVEIYKKNFQYKNITSWFIASNFTKVECIYDKTSLKSEVLKRSVIQINEKIKSLSELDSLSEIKKELRNLKLESLIDKNLHDDTDVIYEKWKSLDKKLFKKLTKDDI